jgi:hypothetical protein
VRRRAPPPETQRLIDELYREELRDARAMRPEDKVLAGQQLLEAACRSRWRAFATRIPRRRRKNAGRFCASAGNGGHEWRKLRDN